MSKPVLSTVPTLKETPKLNTESVDKAREKMFQSKQRNYDLLDALKGTVAKLQEKRDKIIVSIRNKNAELIKITEKNAKDLQHYKDWFNNIK